MTAITKVKKIVNPHSFIIQDYAYSNTLVLMVNNSQLPKNAVIDRVRLLGSFNVNGKEIKDVLLDDILEVNVDVKYHQEYTDENDRVLATMYFPEGVPQDLLDKVLSYIITDFKVYYHEEAIMVAE